MTVAHHGPGAGEPGRPPNTVTTRAQFLKMLRPYGVIYEVVGLSASDISDHARFRSALSDWFVGHNFACSASTDNRHVRILQHLHAEYPELEMEWCEGGELLMCDLGPSSRPALPYLREFLALHGCDIRKLEDPH